MNSLKRKNMLNAYDGFCGTQTLQAVENQITDELFDRLTGRELGLVMSAINKAYHNGKASLGGIDRVDDGYWLPDVGDGGAIIPVSALRKITIVETRTTEYKHAHGRQSAIQMANYDAAGNRLTEGQKYAAKLHNGEGAYYPEQTTTITYRLDHTETY